ncbi:MAG: 16S rRNA (uracil(1498)-N(3))-methyltransferase [Kiritimatiellaceae bacterium]|nr:16S rRNA (uracil(1498)-N(3))-methyltransferase [Kiritimatiellaceae bacterium]
MNLILIHPHEPDAAGRVCLTDDRAEHIRTVLKAAPGKELRIGLLNGPLGRGTLEEIRAEEVILRCEFGAHIPPRPAVDLLLALPRPKVMKRLWAQLAALGVGRIILTNAEKVERFYFDSHVLEPDFYTERLIEGLQQAGDTLIPKVQIVRQLKPFLEDELDAVFPVSGNRLLADPSGTQNVFQCMEDSAPQRVCLAVGPEGGWTPYELELFAGHGFKAFNAGPRILRTDTACVALLGLVSEIQRKEI